MSQPKILMIQSLPTADWESIVERFPDAELLQVRSIDAAGPELQEAQVIAGFFQGEAIERLLRGSHQLRWIQSWSAGVNQYPLHLLRKQGIFLTQTSGVHADQISEIALASMIALERAFFTLHRAQLREEWIHVDDVSTIHDGTVTILGTGAIGQELAQLCRALRMTVIGVNRSGVANGAWDQVYQIDQLKEAVASSDYVVNILPETQATTHVMNEAIFQAMKDGAGYINLGRGATTDTEALLRALDSDKLKGACLDVFEEEPLPQGHPLWKHPKVFVMPHHAGADVNYDRKALEIFETNLRAYLDTGAPTLNLVDLETGY